MAAQQAQHDNFIHSGVSSLDRCNPTPAEALEINRKIEEINKAWDKLQHKLSEREKGLHSMQDLSTQFYDHLQTMSEWLAEVGDTMDALPPVGNQPEVISEQKDQVRVS